MNRSTALLKLLNAPGLGPRKLTSLLLDLARRKLDPTELFSLTAADLRDSYAIEPLTSSYLLEEDTDADETLVALQQREIEILAIGAESYPARLLQALGSQAPGVLFAWGNRASLDQSTVGISGSRKASAEVQQVSAACAQVLAREGATIVSGYAQGVDSAAHGAALEAGGATAVVLPLGILNFQPRAELQQLVDPNNTLVLSEFPPKLGWHSYNAMTRNRTICGLSDVVIVIEAGAQGGSLEAGKMALKLQRPLFVVDFSEPLVSPEGNRKLLAGGAQPLRLDSDLQPDLAPVLAALREPGQATAQTNLFD